MQRARAEQLAVRGQDCVLADHAVVCGTDELAFDVVRRASPSLVLLDVDVAREAQGWALLERLQGDPATVDTPAIVCSTHTHLSPFQAKLLRYARAVYLAKPFTLGTLLATVGAALADSDSIALGERL